MKWLVVRCRQSVPDSMGGQAAGADAEHGLSKSAVCSRNTNDLVIRRRARRIERVDLEKRLER